MKVNVNGKLIDLEVANTFWKKFKGLMLKKNINYGLQLKTNNIHTFFMKEEIDIVMTNKNNQILYYFKNFPRNKILIKRKVYYTYEFPKGFLTKVKTGDIIQVIKE